MAEKRYKYIRGQYVEIVPEPKKKLKKKKKEDVATDKE
jgi:hypothetical protein